MTAINQTVEAATATVAEALPLKAPKAGKPAKGKPRTVDAKPVADATIAWHNADAKAMVSQGAAVAIMARAMKSLGRTHEEVNGEWRETVAFRTFRTDYMMRLDKALGTEAAKMRGGPVIRFALRALRVNLTPDVLEKATGKVQAILETKEEAFKKAGRTKTDHSLGGPQGKGGRPGGAEAKGDVDRIVAYLDKMGATDCINAIVKWAKAAKKTEALRDALAK